MQAHSRAMRKIAQNPFGFVLGVLKAFHANQGLLLAGALAYYMLLSIIPLLTFLSGLCTLLGAMLTVWLYIDIPPTVFITRLREAIDFTSLFSGLFKAPFMGMIIALIACAEGMAVKGSAESLGRRTTASVVKSIFMVIVVDGIFAIFYSAIDF